MSADFKRAPAKFKKVSGADQGLVPACASRAELSAEPSVCLHRQTTAKAELSQPPAEVGESSKHGMTLSSSLSSFLPSGKAPSSESPALARARLERERSIARGKAEPGRSSSPEGQMPADARMRI